MDDKINSLKIGYRICKMSYKGKIFHSTIRGTALFLVELRLVDFHSTIRGTPLFEVQYYSREYGKLDRNQS